MKLSPLQIERKKYQPKLPKALEVDLASIALELGDKTEAVADREEVKDLFPNTYGKPLARFIQGNGTASNKPLTVGVILSGGQAPGGHNVIAGLFDGLKKGNAASRLIGFLGGPSGILENKTREITAEVVDEYRNTGGFDMIASGRTKIETDEQFARSLEVCTTIGIDALVVIGGDDSNTNAALLAEYFIAKGATTQVIGVPKTIDGDLKNEYIESSFGFDTATRTYAELIGNIERDAASAKKYWHFIKLMGRSASHIALECALLTQPNICLISEEVAADKMTLAEVVDSVANAIVARASAGKNFGVALIPEGLIEFIPEVGALITELNTIIARDAAEFSRFSSLEQQSEWIITKLEANSAEVFSTLPRDIKSQLLLDRDPHGNVQVSRIETEKLVIEMVENRLAQMKEAGEFAGKFSALAHFFGYEGRCAFPSNFDADYCYSLGFTAFLLIANGLTGYLSSIRNLAHSADKWTAGGVPLTMMMNMEQRHGHKKPVIRKALVELDGVPFKTFAAARAAWAVETSYVYPGAIQYFGPAAVADTPSFTIRLEHGVRV